MAKESKVYIVSIGEKCEGGSVSGVFHNREDACKFIAKNHKEFRETSRDYWEDDGCDYIEIEEWEVE